MTAPLFLLAAGALDGLGPGSVVGLDGAEGRHASTVRRIRPGERIDVADGTGLLAHAVVAAADRGRLELTLESLDRVPARLPRIVLAQALAKGGRDEQAVETATELGVDALLPWQAHRSVSVWAGDRAVRGRHRWAAAASAAAKQSRRATVPPVEDLVSSAELAARISRASAALVLHEEADAGLLGCPLPAAGTDGDLLVVVGPEGGIGDDELALLVGAGALAVRCGPEVLRTSSAGPAALAVLSGRLGRWQ